MSQHDLIMSWFLLLSYTRPSFESLRSKSITNRRMLNATTWFTLLRLSRIEYQQQVSSIRIISCSFIEYSIEFPDEIEASNIFVNTYRFLLSSKTTESRASFYHSAAGIFWNDWKNYSIQECIRGSIETTIWVVPIVGIWFCCVPTRSNATIDKFPAAPNMATSTRC